MLLAVGVAAAGCGGGDDGDSGPLVFNPQGGSVVAGDQAIQWSNFGDGGTVQVQLSDDGGTTYGTEIAAAADNDGGLIWDSLGTADGENFRIRVRGNDRAARTGVFSVDNTDPVISLTSPVGGELVGANGVITWLTTDVNPGTVSIMASADGGVTFDIPVTDSAPDSGTFDWDASSLADGTAYRVQIIATDRGGNVSLPDSSGGDFELDRTPPTVALTSPNGGETFSGTQDITWTSVDQNPGTVELSVSGDSGQTYSEVIVSDAPDTGTYSWQSGRVEDGTTYRIQVVAIDGAGNRSMPDESDGDFESQNVRLLSPAHYRDTNRNAIIDQGDTLYLRFDEFVTVNGATGADFVLPKAGDTLGAGVSVVAGIELDTIIVTLGANPVLKVRGIFDEDDAPDPEGPSGITLADPIAPDAIESTADGIDAAPIATAELTAEPVPVAQTPASLVEPRRGAAGDLDGDGDLDLVVAVTGGDPSERWEGDGNNGWTLQQSFGTDDTRDVAIGDVDGDGDLDVVTAVAGPNLVWINDGSGALTADAQVLGSGTSQDVDLVDVDGDGDLDALFANFGNQPNTVWLNDGMGAFADSGQTLGARSTSAVVAADFDGDGDMDFFAANDNQDSRMWLNNGSGVFSAGVQTMATQARDVEAADLDRDGDPDIFMSVLGQNQVLINDGDAEFPAGPVFYGNNDNRGVELFDVDGDGDIDAFTVKNLDSGRYWINDGNGVFTEDTVDAISDDSVDVVAGQFDGDSDTDFVVINRMAGYRPYIGSVSGGQPEADFDGVDLTLGDWQSAMALTGDVDQDGDPDLIVPDVVGVSHVLLNDGEGEFTEGSTFGGADARGGDLFDADGDGDLDLIQRLGDTGTITDLFFENDGGEFTDSGLILGLDTYAPGDLDGDGDTDLAVFSATSLETWDRNPTGFLASGQTVLAPGHLVAAFGDFDQDGDLDILSADAAEVRIYENDGIGGFTDAGAIAFPDATAMAVADLDRDGDLDVLMANSNGGTGLTWARNDGGLTFAATQVSLAATTPLAEIQLFDRDEDGNLDLVAADPATGNLLTALGDGDGTFSGSAQTPFTNLAGAVPLDADRDGDLDLYLSRGNDATPAAVADTVLIYN